MKTALLTGLAAFALGASCATVLTGTGSASSVATRASADDTCTGPAATNPSCVVERVLTLETPSPTASASPSATAPGDDDGTADQGRGDRPTTAAPAPAAPAPAAPGVKLRGDGTVDDTQPGTARVAGDDDGTADQGRGDRPRSGSSGRDDDRSGRRGGEARSDRSGSSHDDSDDDRSGRRGGEDGSDRSGSSHDDSDDDRDDSGSSDDDGTADQGSGDR